MRRILVVSALPCTRAAGSTRGIREQSSRVGETADWEPASPPEGEPKMKPLRTFLLGSALAAILVDVAHAVTVFTPPVVPDDNGTFFCLVTNVSTRTLTLMIDVLNVNGETSRHFGFVVPPLQTRAALGQGASGDRLCRITIDSGRSSIRAAVEVQSSSAEIEAVYPVP
jgi:hypothetical protein